MTSARFHTNKQICLYMYIYKIMHQGDEIKERHTRAHTRTNYLVLLIEITITAFIYYSMHLNDLICLTVDVLFCVVSCRTLLMPLCVVFFSFVSVSVDVMG